MATHCHNTPAMPGEASFQPLVEYIGERQTEALQLEAVLEAAEMLSVHNIAREAVAGLVNVALSMAHSLSDKLDSLHLPEGGAA